MMAPEEVSVEAQYVWIVRLTSKFNALRNSELDISRTWRQVEDENVQLRPRNLK